MKKKSFMKTLGTAAAIGAAIGAARMLNSAREEAQEEEKKQEKIKFADLLSRQYVTDLFTAAEAKEWFEQVTKDTAEDTVMYVAYFTGQVAEQFAISDTEPLDPEHYLLQVVQNTKTQEIIQMRLVNFGMLPPKFEALLKENGGKTVFER